MKNQVEPLVTVRCTVYNQEKFIARTIEGFVMQKATFPFEIVIHDDASTDNSARIIKEYEQKYPKRIRAIYETENQYSKGNNSLYNIMQAEMRGKYIAFCEGDDYWIDEYKLQKQIDFLESNPDYGMCFTDFDIWYENEQRLEKSLFKNRPNDFCYEFTLESWIQNRGYTAPMTWVYRKDIMNDFYKFPSPDGSFIMFAHFLATTKIKCLVEETTAVYRSLKNSASHTNNPQKYYDRLKGLKKTQEKLIEKYKLPQAIKEYVNRDYYTKVYKFIGMMGDTIEIDIAKKYCTSIIQRIYFMLCRYTIVRNILLEVYKRKKS